MWLYFICDFILYVTLFNIRSMRNAYNAKLNYEGDWGKEYIEGGVHHMHWRKIQCSKVFGSTL